ncbi:MAG: hypothetical protein JO201_03480 [Verrucomicrobia bacterium]|nr:hypothetical protein [Verrucomicrobiota bacterium]
MRKLIVIGLSILLVGCASLEVRSKTDAELKGRLAEVVRELAKYHTGESDRAVLGRLRQLVDEEHTIERELFRRCRGGDQDACLSQFDQMYW